MPNGLYPMKCLAEEVTLIYCIRKLLNKSEMAIELVLFRQRRIKQPRNMVAEQWSLYMRKWESTFSCTVWKVLRSLDVSMTATLIIHYLRNLNFMVIHFVKYFLNHTIPYMFKVQYYYNILFQLSRIFFPNYIYLYKYYRLFE